MLIPKNPCGELAKGRSANMSEHKARSLDALLTARNDLAPGMLQIRRGKKMVQVNINRKVISVELVIWKSSRREHSM